MVVNGYTYAGTAPAFEDLATAKAKLRHECAQLNEKVMRKAQTGTALAVEFEEKGAQTIANATKAQQTWIAQISSYSAPVTLTMVWENLAGTQTTSTLTFANGDETAFDPAITTGYKVISGSLDVALGSGVTVKVGVTGLANPVLIIGAGSQTGDLLSSLTGISLDTAVKTCYQEFGLSELTETTESGLSDLTQYYFKVNIDGGGVTEYDITTAGNTTIAGVIALMDAAITAAGATVSLTSGDIRITSDSTTAGAIAITAGTTGTDLLATLTGFTGVETAVYAGYQEFGLTGKTNTTIATGLTGSTTYYFKVALNGGAITEYYFTTYANIPLYGELINLLNGALKLADDTVFTGGVFSLTGGDIRLTSDSILSTTSVSITAGRTIATDANCMGEGALFIWEESDTAADRGKVISGEYIASDFTKKYFMGTLNASNSTTIVHCFEATYVGSTLTASTTYVNDFYRRGSWLSFEQVAGKYLAIGSYGKTIWGLVEEGTDKSLHSRFTTPTGSLCYFAGIKAWANTAACAITVTYTEYGSTVAKTLPLITIPSTSVLIEDFPLIPLAVNTDCTITIVGDTSELTMEVTYLEAVAPRNL